MNDLVRRSATGLGAALLMHAACAVSVFAQEPAQPAPPEETAPVTARPGVGQNIVLSGPNAVHQHIEDDAQTSRPSVFQINSFATLQESRDELYGRSGFHIGWDYNSVNFKATDSVDGGDDEAGGGVLRIFAKWDLLGRGTDHLGTLVVKGGHRGAYTDKSPVEIAPDLGYAGLLNITSTDQGWRMTNLYWRQLAFDGELVSYVGYIDSTDFADIYPISSYYTNFSNLVFGTGSGVIGVLPDAALGAMAGGWLTDHVYAIFGIADANPDQTDIFPDGFSSFFNDFDTFKTLDVGWAASREDKWTNNVHVTFYQTDDTVAGAPDGWGVHGSLSMSPAESWLLFLRGGWGHDGGSPLKMSVSTGLGYRAMPYGGLLGVGLNWGRPNDRTYGEDLDDEYTAEIFYRFQVTPNIQFTPSIQLLGNPALDPENDLNTVLGVRARIAF